MRRESIPFNQRFVPHILGTELPVKTVTRRFRPRHVGTHLRAKVPKPGKSPSQWPGFANLIVVDCHSEHLQDIGNKVRMWNEFATYTKDGQTIDVPETHMDVDGEGVELLSDFIAIWKELYDAKPGKRWEDNPPVWRIEFALEPPTGKFSIKDYDGTLLAKPPIKSDAEPPALRLCSDENCTARPHYENCPSCFGFGVIPGGKEPLNASQAWANNMSPMGPIVPNAPCPTCHSTFRGPPRPRTIIGDDGEREEMCAHGVGHGLGVHTCDAASNHGGVCPAAGKKWCTKCWGYRSEDHVRKHGRWER